MLARPLHGITTVVASTGLAFTAILVGAVDRESEIRTAERIPVSLIRLTSGEICQLKAKDGKRISDIYGFEPKTLNVRVLNTTDSRIAALHVGCTEMWITTEEGGVEQLVFVVTSK